MAWTSSSALIVPLGGLVVQPIIAQALGADGRGEVAAALAPAVLTVSVATLGLPESLTYFVARQPRLLRQALAVSIGISLMLGLVCLGVVSVLAPTLSAGDDRVASLIILAMVAALPLLATGAVRGAAVGQQLFSLVAAESLLNAMLRVATFSTLYALDALTPAVAVIVTFGTQLLAVTVYARALARPLDGPSPWSMGQTARQLLHYGGRAWFGSVAGMLLARTPEVLMTPLSSTRDLGLYSVAVTISDLPVLAAAAVAKAVSGVSSRHTDWERVRRTARVTLLVTVLGCSVLALSLRFWLGPVFGPDFTAAYSPTLLLLVSATISAPALVAGAGLGAAGRPGLRSTAYLAAVAVNATLFFLLVPTHGVMGAATAGVVSSSVICLVVFMAAARVSGGRVYEFVLVTRVDVLLLAGLPTRMMGSVVRKVGLARRR